MQTKTPNNSKTTTTTSSWQPLADETTQHLTG